MKVSARILLVSVLAVGPSHVASARDPFVTVVVEDGEGKPVAGARVDVPSNASDLGAIILDRGE